MLILAVAGASFLLLGLAFFTMYRPWHSRWGATDEEIALNMPGDEIIRRPTFNVTRAITVKARPEEIWPWIVQIGFGCQSGERSAAGSVVRRSGPEPSAFIVQMSMLPSPTSNETKAIVVPSGDHEGSKSICETLLVRFVSRREATSIA